MKFTFFISVIILCGFHGFRLTAQSITSRVLDENTGEGVPYATIQLGSDKGTVTNEEGRFSVYPDGTTLPDTLYISSMGYEKRGVSTGQLTDSVIYLKPKPIALEGVYLFDNELTVAGIILKIKENLPVNYRPVPTKHRLFVRHSSFNRLEKLDVAFKESTIAELNKIFIDSVIRILPRNAAYYTESLCDLYRNSGEYRLKIVKAAELYDKNNEGSMEALTKKLEKIFRENVKSNSYLKIKSGIFGQKVQVDSILRASQDGTDIEKGIKEPEKHPYLSQQKELLRGLYRDQFYTKDSKLNFILQSNRYEFDLRGYTTLGDNDVYVIDFTPKRREDFKGTIYVNLEDFAILRMDYKNARSLRRIRLLGFQYEETEYRGTTVFAKLAGDTYDVRFMEKITGRQMGVDRPLQVIEKNKFVRGRRKQNELSLGLDIVNNNIEKFEMIVFNAGNISNGEFSGVEENKDAKATYQSRYDPAFWNGYQIMEPDKAIRAFKVSED